MPEIVTGTSEWRQTLEDEMAALELVQAPHRRRGPARFVVSPDGEQLRTTGKDVRHLRFAVNVDEGDFIEFCGGASATTGFELHEWFATIAWTYEIRGQSEKQDELHARQLARWVAHSITPGALSIGAGRVLDDVVQLDRIRPAKQSPEYFVCTIRIRAQVYLSRALATVPA